MENNSSVAQKKCKLKMVVERFYPRHPYITLFFTLIGLPIAILLAVTLFTSAIVLPISLLMGLI